MSINQAMQLAKKLWGARALVRDYRKPNIVNGSILRDRYCVGRNLMGLFFEIKGDGPTWEAAFEKAERTK